MKGSALDLGHLGSEFEVIYLNHLVLSEMVEDPKQRDTSESVLRCFWAEVESLCGRCHRKAHKPRRKWVKLARSARRLRDWRTSTGGTEIP